VEFKGPIEKEEKKLLENAPVGGDTDQALSWLLSVARAVIASATGCKP
jgi:hypothetical protein